MQGWYETSLKAFRFTFYNDEHGKDGDVEIKHKKFKHISDKNYERIIKAAGIEFIEDGYVRAMNDAFMNIGEGYEEKWKEGV